MIAVAGSAALLVAASCGSSDDDATTEPGSSEEPTAGESAPETTEFSISSTSLSLENVPLLAALDAMRDDGFTIEYPVLSSLDLVVDGLARGDLDFGIPAFSSAAGAVEKGGKITTVMARMANIWTMYATKDITSCEDLAGKRVAIHSETSSSTVMVRDWVEQNCPDTEPEYLIISGSENRYAAMIAGEIDASPIVIADAVNLEQEAGDRFALLTNFSETLPDLLTDVYAVNSDFAAENPNTVKALLKAILEEHRKINEDPAYLTELAEKYSSDLGAAPNQAAIDRYVEDQLFQDDGGLTQEYVDYSLDFMVRSAVIAEGYDPNGFADTSYLDDVLEELG